MNFKQSAVAVLSLATGALGIIVPPNLGDGVWAASLDNGTGEATWTKITDIPDNHPARRAHSRSLDPLADIAVRDGTPLDKRDQTGCTAKSVDATEYTFSYLTMFNWCAAGAIDGHAIVTQVVGNTVWYGCNYNGGGYKCNQNDMTITLNSVRSKCGDTGTGWDHLDVPNVTFGVESIFQPICSNLHPL